MTSVLILNVLTFFILTVIWTKSNLLNFVIKLFFFFLLFCNGILLATDLGYIVKV